MKPLPRRVMLTFFAVVAVVSALVAVAQVVTPIFIQLPNGESWNCGFLPRLLSGERSGYQGGDPGMSTIEFVLANCRPAAFRALAGGIIAILAAAMATVLFIVRRRTP